MIGFQLYSKLAAPKPLTAKRIYAYWLVSMKTLRFTIINRAARVARIHGRKILRFSNNSATKSFTTKSLTALPRELFSL